MSYGNNGVGNRLAVGVLVVYGLDTAVLPLFGIVVQCVTRCDVVVIVRGGGANLNLGRRKRHGLEDARGLIVQAPIVETLVFELHLVAHKAYHRNPVYLSQFGAVGFVIVIVIDIHDTAAFGPFTLEVVVGGDNLFFVRVVRDESVREVGLTELVVLFVLVGLRTDFEDEYFGSVLERGVVAVEQDVPRVHLGRDRVAVLPADGEIGIAVVENVVILVREPGVEPYLLHQVGELVVGGSERIGGQLGGERRDVRLDYIDDDERIVRDHRPVGVVPFA